MESRLAAALQCTFPPIGLMISDDKPENAKQFQPDKWGCVMFLLAAAARGETAAFDRQTFGCFGGGVGLGFGNQYTNFPGGIECFKRFLSDGNQLTEDGRSAGEKVKNHMRPEAFDNFMHGERYLQSPELVQQFIDSLPMTDIGDKYVLLQPLEQIDPDDHRLKVVLFIGDMDHISALSVLANYGRGHNENVIFPFAAGCQNIGIYPLSECERDQPRAVLGLNDISARLYLKRMLKKDVMTFAIPRSLFLEMEENVDDSFLHGKTWRQLRDLSS